MKGRYAKVENIKHKEVNRMKWIRPGMAVSGWAVALWGYIVGKLSTEIFVASMFALVVWWWKSRDEAKQKGSK